MSITVMDLKPCLLVAVDVSRTGGQSYARADIQEERTPDGTLRSTWVTKKVLTDEEEFKEASKIQTACKYAANKLGRHTPVGIVASVDKMDDIQSFRRDWKEQIDDYNQRSKHTRIGFTLMVFEIKGENVQALETVLDELRDGLDALNKAYQSLDPKGIREVVQRMVGFTEILPDRVGFLVDEAIKEAKQKAKAIKGTEKKVARIETKIAEAIGPDRDVEAALKDLSGQRLTASIRRRTIELKELATAKTEAIDAMETTRQQINDTPIRLARFAISRQQATQQDDSPDLMAARMSTRVARQTL